MCFVLIYLGVSVSFFYFNGGNHGWVDNIQPFLPLVKVTNTRNYISERWTRSECHHETNTDTPLLSSPEVPCWLQAAQSNSNESHNQVNLISITVLLLLCLRAGGKECSFVFCWPQCQHIGWPYEGMLKTNLLSVLNFTPSATSCNLKTWLITYNALPIGIEW